MAHSQLFLQKEIEFDLQVLFAEMLEDISLSTWNLLLKERVFSYGKVETIKIAGLFPLK